MLFGALFAAYLLLRVGAADPWPPGATILDLPLGLLATFVLILSNVTMVAGWSALLRQRLALYRPALGLTVALAATFLALQGAAYSDAFGRGLYPSTSTFFALYFTLTGLTAVHVLGGALMILYLWASGPGFWKRAPQQLLHRVEASGLFWHFVGLVWIFLFPLLYLI